MILNEKKEVDTCWYHTYLLYSCDGEIWFPTPNDRRRWRKKEKKSIEIIVTH